MKILRNDTTGFEAKQSRVQSTFVGILFVVIGGGVAIAGGSQKSLPVMLFGLAFLLIGLALVIFTSAIHVTADPATRRLTINYRSVVRHRDTTVAFDDIQKIAETSTLENSGGNNGTPSVQKSAQVMLKNGELITLPDSSGGGLRVNGIPINMFKRPVELGQALATAIGVPFEELGFTSVTGVMNSVTEGISNTRALQAQQQGTLVQGTSMPTVATPPVPAAPVVTPAPAAAPTPAAPVMPTASTVGFAAIAAEPEPTLDTPTQPTPPTTPSAG